MVTRGRGEPGGTVVVFSAILRCYEGQYSETSLDVKFRTHFEVALLKLNGLGQDQ